MNIRHEYFFLIFKMAVTLHTSLGDLRAELFCSQAPLSCRNFLALAASGYYNASIFHRNLKDFMIQGGDPTGEGKGGLNYKGEYQADEIVSELKHDRRGVLSFSTLGKPDTVGSQFFITYSSQAHLDGVYSVFGKLAGNFETLSEMEAVPVGKKSRPIDEIRLERISIQFNPIAEADNPN